MTATKPDPRAAAGRLVEPARVRRSWMGGTGVPIAVVEVQAAQPGPTVVVVANLHGDECTGVGIVHALVRSLPVLLERGRAVLVPSLNPEGLAAGSRTLPGEPTDPNRAFPGNERGRLADRHAARIWRELRAWAPDLVVDLHTDSGGSIPYALVDRVVRSGITAQALEERCRVLAVASGHTVLHEYPRRRYLRFGLDRSLPGALVNEESIAAVTLEIGPRRRIDPHWVEAGTAAALGVLTAAGMVDRPAPRHPSWRSDGPWRRENGPHSSLEGILAPLVSPGSDLSAGQPLAEIRSLDGEVREVLFSEHSGFVVALPEVAHVPAGACCATLAVRDL